MVHKHFIMMDHCSVGIFFCMWSSDIKDSFVITFVVKQEQGYAGMAWPQERGRITPSTSSLWTAMLQFRRRLVGGEPISFP